MCFFNKIQKVLHKKAHLTVSVNKKQLFKLLRSDSREVSKIPEHWHTGGAKMRMANDD